MEIIMEANRKAFGYLRVSGKSQVDGDGFPRQRENIQKWAAANGVEIVQWFTESGVSGTLAERPALSEMMIALMSDGVRLVVVEKLDRIARDQMVQETIIQSLLKQGFELLSAAPGEENLCGSDPGRKLMRTIMGAIAEYDKQMIVLKLRAARKRKRIQSGGCEGRKPYGTRPGEVENIRRIVALYTSGQNYSEIALTMNAENRSTRTKNSKWYPSTIANIVRHNRIRIAEQELIAASRFLSKQ
jgi:DNA invertase Pin-like site-specific DNA recombinase